MVINFIGEVERIHRGRDLTAPQDKSVNRELILRNDERAAKFLFDLGRTALWAKRQRPNMAPHRIAHPPPECEYTEIGQI